MTKKDFDVLLVAHHLGRPDGEGNLHFMNDVPNLDSFIEVTDGKNRGIAVSYTANKVGGDNGRRPTILLLSIERRSRRYGVWSLAQNSARFPQAERYLRSRKWPEAAYGLSPATWRDRTVGIIGKGPIGQAIAESAGVWRACRLSQPKAAKQSNL